MTTGAALRREPARPPGLAALLPYLRAHRGTLAVVGVLSLAGAGASLAQPLLTRVVLDRMTAARPIAGLVVALVALVVVGAAVGGLRDYLLQRTAEGLVLGTRRRLAGHLLRLPIAEYDRRRTGDLLSRVGSDTTLLRAVVTSGLFETVTGAVMVLGAGTAMLLLDPPLFGVTLAAVGVGIGFALTAARRVRGPARRAQERVGEMTSAVERAISAARTIRASRAEAREADTVAGSAAEAYAAGLRVARVQAVVGPASTVTIQGAFLLVLGRRRGPGGRRRDQRRRPGRLRDVPVLPGAAAGAGGARVHPAADRAGRARADRGDPRGTAGGGRDRRPRPVAVPAAPGGPAAIEFDRVGVRLPGRAAGAARGVSFTVPAGTRTALVGPPAPASRRCSPWSNASTRSPRARCGWTASTCGTCPATRCGPGSATSSRRPRCWPARSGRTC